MTKKLQLTLVIFFGSLVIVLAGHWLFLGLSNYKDVLCWDELMYMFKGLGLPNKVAKGWAPFYGFWYFLQAIGQKIFTEIDLVSLYYLNFRILTISCAVSIFVLFSLYKVNPIIAFSLAISFFFSSINLETWPHISHYCVLVIISALIIIHFFKSYITKWLLILFAILLLSYARPEFYLSFLALSLIFIGWLISKKFQFKKIEWLQLVIVSGVFALLHLKMGASLFDGSSSTITVSNIPRDVVAFGQHFTLNYFNWNGIEQDFWLAWNDYFLNLFEVKDSTLATGLTNKPLFFKHLTSNIANWLYFTFDDITEVIFLGKLFRWPIWIKIIFSVLLIAYLILNDWSIKKTWEKLYKSEHGFAILVLFLFAAPTYLASILFYPRDHYILLQIPFLLSFIVFVCVQKSNFNLKKNLIGIGLVSILVLVLFPKRDNIDYFDFWHNRETTFNYSAINYLKNFEIGEAYTKEKPMFLLENEGGLSIYVEKTNLMSITGFKDEDEALPIEEQLENYNVGVVFVTPSLLRNPSITTIPSWENFISKPENYGWSTQALLSNDAYLLIREDD